MRFSVFTVSTPDWEPEQAATILAAQGWDGIEWRVIDQPAEDTPSFWRGNRATWPLTGFEDDLDEIRRITTGAALSYSAIGGYTPCHDHDAVERMLSATAVLGAERVRVLVPGRGDRNYRAAFDETRRHFEWVAERAAAHGVKALVETHQQSLTPSASAAFRMVEGLDPVSIGVIHDLGNLVIEGQEDHVSALQLLGPYLAHVHVKNAEWAPSEPAADGTVTWQERWSPLRTGQADVFAYFRALASVGYDGWVTAEDFSTGVPLEERTRDNLAYLRAVHSAAVGDA